ncbi:glycosyl hydrolase family 28-related protein [Rhodovulum sp. YNF3179]|uniref:glycosyl hydrolase family 28-related protein n=1 Tax=Rhodovulum sp. YNF3179 TaxID=3425127 RepID=UPI003D347040
MNKAITDGLVLMPPAFADGLDIWSRGDGTPGSASYAGTGSAALVPADQDFGHCLELLKTEPVQKLRYTGETPLLPGCYLRIRARVKAVSGTLPSVRIAAWAGGPGGAHVSGVPETGPSVALTGYGQVVTVEAIVGTGTRTGVDMPWGTGAIYGHFGLDMTGETGGVVRIDAIEIEDVTGVFLRDMMDWVDVRDYGAAGDGAADDHAAFLAADAAAEGREILVPAGRYRIAESITLHNRVRFEGRLDMPAAARLSLMQNFDLPSYISAFGGDEPMAVRKALQALMNFTDHACLDMGGRRVQLSEPIDVQAAVDNKEVFAVRRAIRNGQFDAQPDPAWDDTVVTATARYDRTKPLELRDVANAAQIPVGALVTGDGVGREVYVREKNVGAGILQLSQALHGVSGTQEFTFRRFKYVLDFSGFSSLSSFVIDDVDIQCNGHCSAILLAPAGLAFHLRDSFVTKPKDRGITSIGTGCQGMLIDRNQFLSSEQPVRAQDRTSIAFNVNANDVKLRDNRAVKFAHFGVMHGTGHLVSGNHFFQGDDEQNGVRQAGLVLTDTNVQTTITGNYIDNSFIEWGNEHDPAPQMSNEYSFGGLTITGNTFVAARVGPWFRWLVVKPYGPDHFIHGLSVSDNVFRTFNAQVDRVETVDESFATLDMGRARNVTVSGNTFNGVGQFIANPVVQDHSAESPDRVWTIGFDGKLPFGGRARLVSAVVAEGEMRGGSGQAVYAMPWVATETGTARDEVQLTWPEPVEGRVRVTVRMDNPA